MTLRERVLVLAEEASWRDPSNESLERLALSVMALVREECAACCMTATPDREAVKVIGEAAHYMACAAAIRKAAEGAE